jgi:hypothetical protein
MLRAFATASDKVVERHFLFDSAKMGKDAKLAAFLKSLENLDT